MDNLTRTARDWLSLKALVPLSYLQQMARPSVRRVRTLFFDGLRFRQESAAWGQDRKREWIIERLRLIARRAYRETSYYRELFDRIGFDPMAGFSFEDYSRLPVLEREDVQRAGKRLVSRLIPESQLRRDATGGSSGSPTEIWLGPEERAWRDSSAEYFMQRLGIPTGTRIGNLWGHHLDPVASDSLRDRFYSFVINNRWFDCFRLSPEVLETYHQEFERWRPTCIVAYASALGSLAEYVLERGYRPSYPTRCFVTGAEKLLPYNRQLIETAFKRPVHERYGSRDAGYVGFQMSPDASLDYEIDWANLLIEPETDQTGSPILITKLHADGMLMIRYRIDDVGQFPEAARPGHPTFVLHEVIGRVTDGVWLPDGRWILGHQFPHLMKDYPVQEFMLHQHSDYHVRILIVPKSGFGDESRRGIENTVKANLPGLGVRIELVERIPRTKANKLRPVVSEVHAERRAAR